MFFFFTSQVFIQTVFFVFPAAIASKASSPPQQTSLPNNVMDAAVSQGTASQHAMENYFSYSQQPGEYPQVGVPQPGVPWSFLDSPRAAPCFLWVLFLPPRGAEPLHQHFLSFSVQSRCSTKSILC